MLAIRSKGKCNFVSTEYPARPCLTGRSPHIWKYRTTYAWVLGCISIHLLKVTADYAKVRVVIVTLLVIIIAIVIINLNPVSQVVNNCDFSQLNAIQGLRISAFSWLIPQTKHYMIRERILGVVLDNHKVNNTIQTKYKHMSIPMFFHRGGHIHPDHEDDCQNDFTDSVSMLVQMKASRSRSITCFSSADFHGQIYPQVKN